MSEPELQYSSVSGPFERAGLTFEIQVYKAAEDPDWVLEVVDEHGTSHVFEDRFTDEAEAHACAVEAIESGEVDPLAEEQEALLDAYGLLGHPDVEPGLSRPPMYILGVLTALHTTPSVPPVAEVFGELFSSNAGFLETALESISELHLAVGDCLESDQFWIPALNSYEDALQWSSGYLSVVERDPVWMKEEQADPNEMLAPIVALARGEEPATSELPEVELLCDELDACAAGLYDHWRDLRRTLAAEQGAATFKRETPKVGRNELCPCGSGKKYKKCCLRA